VRNEDAMTTDYLVASLPALDFDAPPPLTREEFLSRCGGVWPAAGAAWRDLDTQLRNALAEARGALLGLNTDAVRRWEHPAEGCALYWRGRVKACFQETDVFKREKLLDRVWWDAAGELVPPAAPLGREALAAYAIRLEIALKRAQISPEKGNAAFDRLTAETKRD